MKRTLRRLVNLVLLRVPCPGCARRMDTGRDIAVCEHCKVAIRLEE
jgi:hypothetical protein